MNDLLEKLDSWEKNEGKCLFQQMYIRRDAKILDYGCGYGHYTLAASRASNEDAKIYAVDINKSCLKKLKEKLKEEKITNVEVQMGNKDFTLNFEGDSLDAVLYYDLLHGGDGSHKKILLKEAHRVLKENGILSVLPFHLANFRDDEGNKKKYTYAELIREINSYGFELMEEPALMGTHFEKCHSSYQLSKGNIDFNALPKAEILNFFKL